MDHFNGQYERATPEQVSILERFGVKGAPDIPRWMAQAKINNLLPTPRQIEVLENLGVKIDPKLTKWEAIDLIGRLTSDRRSQPATPRQQNLLRSLGGWTDGLTIDGADERIRGILAEREQAKSGQW